MHPTTEPDPIDPQRPIPLYQQIAERIRSEIETGRLAPNQSLDPLRKAAEEWGVNLHTVRHAYAALAREGLLEIQRGSGGTRVSDRAERLPRPGADPWGEPPGDPRPAELDDFVQRCLREARDRFGVGREVLADLIAGTGSSGVSAPPVVYVVECSEHQCTAHARELARRYEVDARPWPLERGEPPAGTLVATYFHYNDIRRCWPLRLGSARFLTIRPDPVLRSRLHGRGPEILVCERDLATAEAVAGDLEALLAGAELHFVPAQTEDPAALLRDAGDRATVVLPPRVWADLSTELRHLPSAVEVTYRFDPDEIDALGAALCWPERRGVRENPGRAIQRRSRQDRVDAGSAGRRRRAR